MNKNCFRLVFSRRLNALIVVGENVRSAGKAASGARGSSRIARVALSSKFNSFIKALVLLTAGHFLLNGVASAQTAPSATLATQALPSGGKVIAGHVATAVIGSTMTINQGSDKAIINWNAFNIGSHAKVNIVQPNSNSLQLNRVIGNNPSQIMGQLSSNGQIMLVNPNGIVVGKDGFVSASGFTASSYGITDADFMAGNHRFQRNGTVAGVRNDGSIETTSGGYVALIGVEVTNNGKIIAPRGNVIMAAGEAVTVPGEIIQAAGGSNTSTSDGVTQTNISVPLSSRVRVSVTASAINTAVTNTKDGVIVTDGGQVLLQAAALSDAVASVTHSGKIDTSSNRAGNVAILADHGNITVDGSITANSKIAGVAPANIIIGRDVDTNVLASNTNASGAKIQAKGGFVETSAETLKVDGARVEASTWLLDPNDIVIGTTATTGGTLATAQAANGISYILASDVNTALTAGTNVIIATSSSATGGNGDITVNTAISNTAAGNTLTLNAGRNIVLNSGITASNISLNAATGSVSGSGALAASGLITINTAAAGTLSGLISGAAGLTKSGAGTLTLRGSNTYSGVTKILSGTLSLTTPLTSYSTSTGLGSLFKSSQFITSAGATLNFNIPTNVTQTGNTAATTFSGLGTLSKTGGGILNWGANVFFNLGAGSLIDVQQGEFVGANNYWATWTNNLSSLNIVSGATFTGSEGALRFDALTGDGKLQIGWTSLGSLTIGLNNNAVNTYNAAGTALFTGTIVMPSGATNASVTKTGTGTQVLTGANAYKATTVSAGTLQIGNSGTTGTLGTGDVTVSAGANLNFNRSDSFTVANNINGAGAISQNGSGVGSTSNLTLTGDLSSETGVFNVNRGTMTFSALNIARRFNGSAINVNNGSTAKITSTANNFYAFGTNWNFDSNGGGTINASPSANWVMGLGTTSPTNTFTTNGGATNTISGAYTGGINTSSTATNTTFNVASGTSLVGLNIAADLWNTGSITKTGAGLMSLTGSTPAGNYTGAVNVNGGTLQVGDGTNTGYLGSGAVTLANGSTLSYVRGANTTISNTISGNGNVVANIVGTLTDSSPINLTSGSINLNATGNIALNANMTAAGSGGISVTAGNSAASTSTIVAAAGATLTQSSGSGNITLTTTGTGDLTVPKIVDNGSGNVILAAGSMLSVGNTNGNIKTVVGNSVTLSGSDKLYVYSGSQSATGSLSVLNSGFSTLHTTGSGYTTNAQISTAYGSSPNTISGGANTQVLFRDSVKPVFGMTLSNLTKTYGDIDPTGGYSVVGNPTDLTYTSGNNTYSMLTSTALAGLSSWTGARIAGETVGSYQYTGITQSLSNVQLVGTPKLVIGAKNLTITGSTIATTYNGVSTYQDLATAAGFSVAGLVNTTVNGVTINDSVTSLNSVFTNSGVAQAGDATRTISGATGLGLSNYNITYTNAGVVTGNVDKATLNLVGATTTSTYSGATQTNTYSLSSASGTTINATNALGADTLFISGQASGRNVLAGGAVHSDSLTVSAGSGTSLSNYSIVTTQGSLKINPHALILSAVADTKVYDGTTLSSQVVLVSGLQATDTVSATQTFNAPGVLAANSTNIVAYQVSDGNGGANYKITTNSAKGTIVPATVVIGGVVAKNKNYDATTSVVLDTTALTTVGVVAGESINTTVTGQFVNASAGVAKPVLLAMSNTAGAFTDLSNYNITNQTSTTANINSVPVTTTVKTASATTSALVSPMSGIAPAISAPATSSGTGSVKTGGLAPGAGQASPFVLSSLQQNSCSNDMSGESCDCEEVGNDLQICQVPQRSIVITSAE